MPTTAQVARSAWLRNYRPTADPAVRLVCLPHAGGTAAAFRAWPSRLPSTVEALAVSYPGRQDRLAEPCIESMPEMVRALGAELLPLTARPLVLFGHSMGASIAHEVAVWMAAEHGVTPAALLVSGRRPPRLITGRAPYLGGDDEIIADVHRLGEASSAALAHPDLRELVLPAIRSDYRLLGTYQPSYGVTSAPITAYVGDGDPDIDETHIRQWAEHTTGEFDHVVLPGDHFFLATAEEQLLADVIRRTAIAGRTPAPRRTAPTTGHYW